MQSAAGIQFFPRNPDAFVPTKHTPSAVGYDLRCPNDILIEPRETESISLGLGRQLPHGCVGLYAPCSDWNLWDRLDVMHDVDTTSCANLTVTLQNNSDRPLEISRGERVLPCCWRWCNKHKQNKTSGTLDILYSLYSLYTFRTSMLVDGRMFNASTSYNTDRRFQTHAGHIGRFI
jgi:dUTPase